jgi:hypothetical protein
MWDESEQQIEPELGADERLLWSGRPRQGVLLRASDLGMIPFSLLWGGFSIVWEVTAIVNGAPLFFKLGGLLFILLGLYLIVGRFWLDARRRAKTYYGITNKRVIIIAGLFRRSVNWWLVDVLKDVSVTVWSDGTGTVTLGRRNLWNMWMGGRDSPPTGLNVPPMLDLIDDARAVYETIRNAQREAKQSIGNSEPL